MSDLDKLRFEIIKAMLTEFPKLRRKVKEWLQERKQSEKQNSDAL